MRKILIALVCNFLLAGFQASADEMKHGGIMVEQPWARASAGPAKAGAAYMTLANMGNEADRLIDVKSELAARTEMHNHIMENGVMKMRKVDGIEVAPGTPTALQPGGLHIMFLGLKKPFVEGEKLPLTLVFKNAGVIKVEFVVQGVGAMKSMPGMPGMHKNSSGS